MALTLSEWHQRYKNLIRPRPVPAPPPRIIVQGMLKFAFISDNSQRIENHEPRMEPRSVRVFFFTGESVRYNEVVV